MPNKTDLGNRLNRNLSRAIWLFVLAVVPVATLGRGVAQLSRVRQPSLPSGMATLSGTVLDEAGLPVGAAHVTLKAEGFEPAVRVADDQGRFAFTDLPEKLFELRATSSDWIETIYGQMRPGLPGTPIRLAVGQHVNVVLRMFRGAIISGMADDGGRPVAGIRVIASRLEPLSDDEEVQLSTQPTETDEQGLYRLTGLQPGRYIVFGYPTRSAGEVTRKNELGQDEVVMASGLYYPDATGPDTAERFALDTGEERRGINLHLHWVPVTCISGVVRFADGQPGSGASIQLESESSVDSVSGSGQTIVDATGRFELKGVVAGSYKIVAHSNPSAPDRGGPQWAHTTMSSDGRTPAEVTLVLEPGATVSGVIVFDGRSTPLPSPDNLKLWLGSLSGSLMYDVPSAFWIDESRRFTFRGVPPGHFKINVQPETARGWTIKSELVNGRDALDFPFDIRDREDISNVVITFTDQHTELSGTVLGADGRPNSDRTVVLFAADDRYWTPRSRRIETVRPDINGRFSFSGLPTGEYVVAVAEPYLFGRPVSSVLRILQSGSIVTTLREGEKKMLDLQVR